MKGEQQLVALVPNLTLGEDYVRGELFAIDFTNVSFLSWPDHQPCLLANLYILELLNRRLSTEGRGGTIRQYAHNIGHLLRYCFYNEIDLLGLTNARFTIFVNGLRVERDPKNPKVPARDANTLITIGRNCLDFLSFVGKFFNDEGFVAPTGRIRAEKRQFEVRMEGSNRVLIRFYWHHKSLGRNDPKKHRSPIDGRSVKQIYQAIVEAGSSNHVVRRRQCTIRIMEMLGPRVGEIASLRVSDVVAAWHMKTPMLRLRTLKKRDPSASRMVPLLRQDLAEIRRYIDVHRQAIIRQTIGRAKDHGFVFVSELRGQPLSARTLSNEVGLLRRIAGIERKACAHMFRNRFITKMLIWMIEQYDLQNPDQLRKALLSTETLKLEILQWTGQSSTKSLDPYIDLAFKEFTKFKKAMSAVDVARAYDAFDGHMDRLVAKLEEGMSIAAFKQEYEELCANRDSDLKSATSDED